MRKIELLAPAADLVSGKTAIDCGADAVYIGGPAFGARRAASNSVADITALVEYARPFGVRVYATLNTVVFTDELPEAEDIARQLIGAGVDALIIQDMAYLRMGLSGVEFHASTQAANTTADHIRFLQENGFSRVILERGLTLDRIKEIRRSTSVELECFVHGAICVGYSGRCYLSRSMSPRSGNRGECAQPCRMTYDLIDAEGNTIIQKKHLFSVRDLNLSGDIAELIDAGVDSFKIEGRLKDRGYIKNIVSYYNDVLNNTIAGRKGLQRASSGRVEKSFVPDPAKSFSRGFTDWMLHGKKRGVASFDTPKAVGEFVGRVGKVRRDSFLLEGDVPLRPGDGICFIAEGQLAGTNVNRVENEEIFPNKMTGIVAGAAVYRNSDSAFDAIMAQDNVKRIIDIEAEFHVTGGSVELVLADGDGNMASASLDTDGEAAKDPVRMQETIKAQLSKSGNTIFNIGSIRIINEDGALPFIPVSQLNDLRRRATDALLDERRNMAPVRETAVEDRSYPCPLRTLEGEANVTNPLAEQFYRDHGVEHIEPGYDLTHPYDFAGIKVMATPYCIRREIGECLRESPRLKSNLFLRRGSYTYRLDFDCACCEMNIIKEPENG